MSIVLSVLLSYSFCIIGQFYLNGTIKIRGGSSCFERQLRYSSCCIPLLCPEQSGSLILCHAHTHCEKIRFSTPKRLWPGPFFLTIIYTELLCALLQLTFYLLVQPSLDSFSKIWSLQLRRKERKMCFGDKQRNFHSQLLSIESLLSWERWLHFAHFIWLQNDNFHEYDSHFLSRDLRRKRFSDQLLWVVGRNRRRDGIKEIPDDDNWVWKLC